MADQYTPEEIQEIFDRYNDAVRKGIPISENLANEMANATKGVKNYTYMLNSSFKQLGSSLKVLGKELASGKDGASVFNDSLESTGQILSTVASKFGIFGNILGGAIKAGAAYVGAVNKQSDALYKSFQELSKTGTVGAGGMAEVFNSMQKFGYAVDELGEMQALLAKNSTALANFGGTAFDGARALSDVAQVLQRGQIGERFRNMGLGVDDINQNIAGFIKTQIALGRGRASIEATLTTESQKYIEQIVAVQKLTGQTREQLEEKQAQAQREEAFAYTQYELKKRAAAGDEQARKEYERNQALSQILEGKAREQFIAGIGGDVAAMGDLMRTAPEFVQGILTGSDLPTVMNSLAKESKRTVENLGPLAKFHAFNDFLLPMDQLLEIMAKYDGTNFDELMKSVKANTVTVDQATKDQTQTRMQQMDTRQAMENMVNAGINPVTKAMKILANAVDYLTNLLPFSGRAKARYEQEQAEQAAKSASKLTGSVIDKIIQVESGGRNIGTAGGRSSAFGIGQMTRGTFEDLARKASPTSALYGKTFEDMKADVGLQREALSLLTTQNQAALSKSGLGTSDANTYLAHFLGVGGATKVLQAPDNAPISSVVGADQIQANPGVFGGMSTAGDLKAWAAKKMGQQMSGAFGFNGMVSGPMSGYTPNLVMHGTEQLSITPMGSANSSSTSTGGNGTIADLIDKVEDLISISKSQLTVNERILKMQH